MAAGNIDYYTPLQEKIQLLFMRFYNLTAAAVLLQSRVCSPYTVKKEITGAMPRNILFVIVTCPGMSIVEVTYLTKLLTGCIHFISA